MQSSASPLQPNSAGPDLTDPATQWAVYRRAQAVMFPDLPDPTPEEFRAAVNEVTANLELEAEAGW